MVSPDKFSRLEDLAAKLGKLKVSLGSEWAKQSQSAAREREKADRPKITYLEEAVAGQVRDTGGGKYYHIQKVVTTVWPEARAIVDLYKKAFVGRRKDGINPDLETLTSAPPENITYLDIETCGFAGTTIFLVGWCRLDGDGELVVEQALARDYAEEASILRAVAERMTDTRVLVTFNGKSFDLPSLRERAIIHRVRLPEPVAHVDILHQARSQWKHILPNCQLQTLELFLCRRPRRGDVPGAAIPQIYHDFVKNLDARKLKLILHHNFLDIVTLAEITARLLVGRQPEF